MECGLESIKRVSKTQRDVPHLCIETKLPEHTFLEKNNNSVDELQFLKTLPGTPGEALGQSAGPTWVPGVPAELGLRPSCETLPGKPLAPPARLRGLLGPPARLQREPVPAAARGSGHQCCHMRRRFNGGPF